MEEFWSERWLKYPFVFLVGFVVTQLLTPVIRWLAPRFGLVDMPGVRRIHKTPVPRCGVSVFLGFHVACAAVYLFPWLPFGAQLSTTWWSRYLIVSTGLLVVGLLDDRKGLRPLVKMAGQAACATLAYLFDMRVGNILGVQLSPMLDYLATLVWFLALINAFNLIDGIDGLATGLAAIAAAGIAGSFLFRHEPGSALVLFGFMGACLAFLRYNFQPASIFLGDSGSMFLGFTLAAIAVGTGAKGTALTAIGVPLLAVGVPLLDTLLAIWRRTARRLSLRQVNAATGANGDVQNIFAGDTDHLHHRLVRTGLSHRATATSLYLVNGALVAVGLLSIIFRSRAVGIYTLAFVAGAYVIVRYLANIELWDSGTAISQGIRRPGHRALSVLLAPLWDVPALALSLLIACLAGSHRFESAEIIQYWFDQLPLWVGVPFLMLVLIRTYSHLWSRARPSEYLLLAVTVIGGILAAAGLAIVTHQPEPPLHITVLNLTGAGIPSIVLGERSSQWLFWQVVVYVGCAVPLVMGPRVLPRLVQDAMGWGHWRRPGDTPVRNVLLYGAGFGASLYLIDRSFAPPNRTDRMHVIALVDDDPLMRNRLVSGYSVIGGIAQLKEFLGTRHVDDIIVTTKLRPDVQARLLELADKYRFSVSTWQISLTSTFVPPDL